MTMNKNMWRWAATTVGVGLLALCGGANAAPAPSIEWKFGDAASPAWPDANTTSITGARAQVTPGPLSVGWVGGQPALDGATGLWDLGQSGTIHLEMPDAGLGGVTVEVRQWNDGFIYCDCAAVSVPGATMKKSSQTADSPGPIGGWITQRTVWVAVAGSSINSVEITGSTTGAVIDQAVVVAEALVPAALVLSIQPTGSGALELSWPESAGSAAVESAENPNDSQGWALLGLAPQLSAGRYSVVVDVAGATRYFRLKQ
jgi:hypothetical protein